MIVYLLIYLRASRLIGGSRWSRRGNAGSGRITQQHRAIAVESVSLEYLIIGTKRRPYYVQFAGEGHHGMRVEAVSNAFIDEPADQLNDAQHERLAALGWDGPAEIVPRPDAPPGASAQGNFFVDVAAPVPLAPVAESACATLRHVYGVAHPGELAYRAFHGRGDGIRFPTLHLLRVQRFEE